MSRSSLYRIAQLATLGFGGLVAFLALAFLFVPDAGAQGAGWTRTKKIIMNTTATGANVATDVVKYPVPVRLTAANFDFEAAKGDGADLRFTDAAGNKLPYEIEHWDPSAKKAMVWVKCDVKGNDDAQYITMHWGNSTAVSESNPKAVFAKEDGWVGVWHLNEAGNTTAGGYKDATANEAHATGTNLQASHVADCVTGRCPEFLHSARRSINIGGEKAKLFNITQKLTFSIWAKATGYGEAYVTHFAKGDKSWRVQMFGINTWGSHNGKYLTEMCLQIGTGDGSCLVHNNDEAKPGVWRLLTVVHDYPRHHYYMDNNKVSMTTNGEWWSGEFDVGIGWQSQYRARWFSGNLDEARVLNVPKGDAWVKLDFESQRPDSRFLTFAEGSTGLPARTLLRAGETRPAGRFDLSGRPLAASARGLVLEKRIGADGAVVTRKLALLP